MHIMGIDPGFSGALAVLDENLTIEFVMDANDLLLFNVKRMVALNQQFCFVGSMLFKGLTG